jgi:hypothetical protein
MTLTLPIELQHSYLKSRNYPENLIPGGTATYRSKLASYKKRLDDAESDLCLVEGEDAVDEDFEIPIIDIEDGKGKLTVHLRLNSTKKHSSTKEENT